MLAAGITSPQCWSSTPPEESQGMTSPSSRQGSRAAPHALGSILLVLCPKSGSKGTAFFLESGVVVTAAHVIGKTRPKDIVGVTSSGDHVEFSRVMLDEKSDLALLRPTRQHASGLRLSLDGDPDLGAPLWAWGFPFGYVGPAPLVTVGYLAGHSTSKVGRRHIKHLIVNGAFNIGNSGGPICREDSADVVGVVVNKKLPLDPFVDSALEALAQQKVGPLFTAVNANGSSKPLTQSELLSEVFAYFRSCLQVMIGEAVSVRELRRLLSAHEREMRPRGARS